jgi:NTE family protein
MNANPLSQNPARALVLAGGGAAGNAWQIGLAAGLFDARIDLRTADLVVGTSAGSTVAAQLTSGLAPDELYAAVRGEARPTPTQTPAPSAAAPPYKGAGGRRPVSGPDYLQWSDAIIAAASDPADMRRRMGAAALERDTSDGADAARWRAVVASRLPSHAWPRQRILIMAVDARTGEPVVFDRDSGIELVDAVAASTSAMTPYRIGDRRYLNGGYRRSENADLAAGSERVLVLSPFGGRSRMQPGWGMDLATQVGELEAGASRVVTVFPDARAGDVFDANALDPATRGRAARGGYDQGRELAAGPVGELWR